MQSSIGLHVGWTDGPAMLANLIIGLVRVTSDAVKHLDGHTVRQKSSALFMNTV